MKTLFKQLKNGAKFKTNCYQQSFYRKASERTATDENLNIIYVLPLAEIIPETTTPPTNAERWQAVQEIAVSNRYIIGDGGETLGVRLFNSDHEEIAYKFYGLPCFIFDTPRQWCKAEKAKEGL